MGIFKAFILFTLFCFSFWNFSQKENIRAAEAAVVFTENDVVTVEDNDGNLWKFYGNGFVVGEKIVVIFSDNNTSSIEDDKIIGVE